MGQGQYSARRVRGIPILFRKSMIFLALSLITPALAFGLAWVLFPTFGISHAYIGFAALVLIPAQALGVVMWIPTQNRLVKLAQSNGGLVCIHCGYDLSSRLTSEVCPECGKTISDEEARAAWGVFTSDAPVDPQAPPAPPPTPHP